MSGLKEIRDRLASARSTQQLTNAMKMVSVSKLRKAQNRATRAREMTFRVMEIYKEISRGMSGAMLKTELVSRMHGCTEPGKVVVIVIASDKGMCGTFNVQVCKKAEAHIKEKYSHLDPDDISVITIGAKAADYFKNKPYRHFFSKMIPNPGSAVYEEASRFMNLILNDFRKDTFQRVELIYSRPVNAATQSIKVRTILPVNEILKAGDRILEEYKSNQGSAAAGHLAMQAKVKAAGFQDVEILPDRQTVVEALLPKIATLYFYLSLSLSAVAEHGARMTAMSQASDNADTLIKTLNLRYNKLRQSSITNELMEIVSGANALSD